MRIAILKAYIDDEEFPAPNHPKTFPNQGWKDPQKLAAPSLLFPRCPEKWSDTPDITQSW